MSLKLFWHFIFGHIFRFDSFKLQNFQFTDQEEISTNFAKENGETSHQLVKCRTIMKKYPNHKKGKSGTFKKKDAEFSKKRFDKPKEIAKAPVYDKDKFIELNRKHKPQELKTNEIRLNRYIAQSGICGA